MAGLVSTGHGREELGEPSTSGQEVLMPPQRRNWKRCASHVYIAHFIDYQIQTNRCAPLPASHCRAGSIIFDQLLGLQRLTTLGHQL